MQRLFHAMLAGAALLAFSPASIASAQTFHEGKVVTDVEIPRSTNDAGMPRKNAKTLPAMKADRSAKRDLQLDEAAAVRAFTLVGRSKDGKEIRIEPNEKVIKSILGDPPPPPEKRTELKDADPQFADDEASRQIVGGDSRVQMRSTTTFPFMTIGYLQGEAKNGDAYGCTAALIGPKTLITAGQCLYLHALGQDAWLDNFTFWPAINGENTVPYGGWGYESAYVFDAFISNYDGTYDTVWPYDIGLITLADPIGDSLGWMGYGYDPNLGDFQGNLAGYHDDKTAFTMWREACDVVVEEIFETDFTHRCDTTWSTVGAPIYTYDKQTKNRAIVGINVGESGDANWALRIYPAVYDWIETIYK